MILYLASINSGSNGNCYYVGNEHDAILVDAGISCRETLRRMERLGLSPHKIRAVFISHEHTDHTKGVEVLSRRLNIPVYMSPSTYLNSMIPVDQELLRTFSPEEGIAAGSLLITPFSKKHDGIDPHSFTIRYHEITVGVLTDIGEVCPSVIRHFSGYHAAFLEANYDETMLEEGPYPIHLKRRIRSSVGHLSNHQALELFLNHRAPYLSHLILSHLSEQNNRPDLVERLFSPHANGTTITVASRYQECGVFEVKG